MIFPPSGFRRTGTDVRKPIRENEMKRAAIAGLALAAAALANPSPARAWDDLGHRVVARIAWETMTPAARERAVALLRAAPEETGLPELWRRVQAPDSLRGRELFVAAGTWADVVRGRDFPGHAEHRSDWHYVNYFWRQETTGAPWVEVAREPVGQLVSQLMMLSDSLDDASVSPARKGVQLAWVLHQVGDVHQPMHTSSRLSALTPDGDRGANDFPLAGDRRNLHSYWDGVLTRIHGRVGEDGEKVGAIARDLMAAHAAPVWEEPAVPADATAWARGSFAKATWLFPAELQPGQDPPASYDELSRQVAEARIAMAGYRLGALLNEALAD